MDEEEKRILEFPITDFYRVLFSLIKGILPYEQLDSPEAYNVCKKVLLLQKAGLDALSLEALKECMSQQEDWFKTLPLLPNPYYGVRLLYVDKRLDWKTRLEYSYLKPYKGYVRLASLAFGVDEDLLFSVMRQESLYNRFALSSSDAMGLMQIIPRTAVWIAADNFGERADIPKFFIPFFTIKYGTWYLASLLEDYPAFLAIAAYNSGPTSLNGWLKKNPWIEDASDVVEFYYAGQTREYVRKILVNYYVYKFLLK